MRRASKPAASRGIAAASLLFLGAVTLLAGAPAFAQTAPPPNPLSDLLPNLLQPLAPILGQPAPPAPAGGSSGGGATSGGATARGAAPATSVNAKIPSTMEVHCGPTPAPLVFARTPGRTTEGLINAAAQDAPAGTSVQAELLKIAAPFPLAGSAHYRDDWGEPRSTPCPHLHQGNDIFANAGTPVVAPESGVLVRFSYEAVGGNCFYLAGDDGYSFYGAHMQDFASGVHAGQHVAAGTVLGTVGSTGDAAGGASHLHFELFAPGKGWSAPEDPKFWLDGALSKAITSAGGIADGPDSAAAQAAPVAAQLSAGSLMASVRLVGGHIISQPTVPVLLFVLLVLGVLAMAQTKTFKVAADLRRSRSSAVVPTFLVGGISGTVAAPEAPGRKRRRRGRAEAADPEEEGPSRPVWAVSTAEKPEPPKPSRLSRTVGRVGDAWERLPATLSQVSSAKGSPKGGTATSVMERSAAPRASWTPPGGASGNGRFKP